MMCFVALVVATQLHTTHKVQHGIITMRTIFLHGDLRNKAIQFIKVVIAIITLLDQMIYDCVGTRIHHTLATIDVEQT